MVDAKVSGRDLPISTKQAIEICCMLRGRDLSQSRELLEQVLEMKRPVYFHRYHRDMGHKKGGGGPGRFPLNAVKQFTVLLKSLEGNAAAKGMDTGKLYIRSIKANRAGQVWHMGRWRRRKMKRTHVDIIAAEWEGKPDTEKQKVEKAPRAQGKTN